MINRKGSVIKNKEKNRTLDIQNFEHLILGKTYSPNKIKLEISVCVCVWIQCFNSSSCAIMMQKCRFRVACVMDGSFLCNMNRARSNVQDGTFVA